MPEVKYQASQQASKATTTANIATHGGRWEFRNTHGQHCRRRVRRKKRRSSRNVCTSTQEQQRSTTRTVPTERVVVHRYGSVFYHLAQLTRECVRHAIAIYVQLLKPREQADLRGKWSWLRNANANAERERPATRALTRDSRMHECVNVCVNAHVCSLQPEKLLL